MRIYCESLEVFGSAEGKALQRLLMRVRLGQHRLILEDVEGFLVSMLFERVVPPADHMEVRELLERQAPTLLDRDEDPARPMGPRAELVEIVVRGQECQRVGDDPVWRIDPATAGDWAESPLRVLLENDDDWVMVATAARVYGRALVTTAQEAGWLLKDQRGGKTQVRKAAKACKQSERIFVLMDSDVAGVDDRPQADVRKLAKSRPNIYPFILRKREVENYVPVEVWQAMVPNGAKSDAARSRLKRRREWERLTDGEKDSVDLEAYFLDAKIGSQKLADPTLVPDAATLERRAGTELVELLDALEAWL